MFSGFLNPKYHPTFIKLPSNIVISNQQTTICSVFKNKKNFSTDNQALNQNIYFEKKVGMKIEK